MNRYENGKIYKIVDVGYNKCYIGSTCESLSRRMSKHRDSFRKGTHDNTVHKIFHEFGLENCKIELIENYPCESKEELNRREGHYIKTTDCINKLIAGRTNKEWREDNNEHYQQKKKEWENNNVEHMKEWRKSYYEETKEKQKAYSNEYKRARRIHINCPCGSIIYQDDLKKHERTQKHQNYLNHLYQSSGINNSS